MVFVPIRINQSDSEVRRNFILSLSFILSLPLPPSIILSHPLCLAPPLLSLIFPFSLSHPFSHSLSPSLSPSLVHSLLFSLSSSLSHSFSLSLSSPYLPMSWFKARKSAILGRNKMLDYLLWLLVKNWRIEMSYSAFFSKCLYIYPIFLRFLLYSPSS